VLKQINMADRIVVLCKICNSYMVGDECFSCHNMICDNCSLEMCDWCDNMRTSCDACPICNKVVTLCGGNKVCMSWINTGMYTNEIGYCMTHNNLVPTDSPPKSCTVIYDPESVNLKYQILYGKE
jgi:hypothetical protein